MGSKSGIAAKIVAVLPAADTFVDLFAGGCAITHAAMLSGKYRHIITNDLGDAPDLFRRAIEGEFHDERRWITRAEFFSRKDADPPYDGTAAYTGAEGFDGSAFRDWARQTPHAVFISEYTMPADFDVIAAWPKRDILSGSANIARIEKIYRAPGK